jgi:hypothetical protein
VTKIAVNRFNVSLKVGEKKVGKKCNSYEIIHREKVS